MTLTLLSCVLHNARLTLEALYAIDGALASFLKDITAVTADRNGAENMGSNLVVINNFGCCSHKRLRSAYEIKIYAVALTNIVF